MRPMNLRRRLAVAGTVGVAALIATLGIGAGVAGAVPADPPGGATPVYPSFDNGVVSGIRNTGSDTTFYMMQKIGDLYTSAGLYGCTLNAGTEGSLYNSGFTSAPSNANYYCQKGANITTTDTADNWDRTEITEGVDDVGSGAGQSQLCGASVLATPLPVDFSRSSKPAGTACSTLEETGYAKDSVPLEEFAINPANFGTAAPSSPYASVNGGSVGDVAQGWLPGNPTGGPYTGTAFSNISNADNGGAANSTAYRIWCATGSTQIDDWGQLTNLGPNLAVPNVTLTSGSNTATITGSLPTSIASGQAVTDLTNSGNLASGTTVPPTSTPTPPAIPTQARPSVGTPVRTSCWRTTPPT